VDDRLEIDGFCLGGEWEGKGMRDEGKWKSVNLC
jgi:hypothetical protein